MKHLLAAVLFLAAAMPANAQTLGPEVVQNGGFDTASGWTLGNGWQITPGPTPETGLAFHNEGSTAPIAQPTAALTAGTLYRTSYTITGSYTSTSPMHMFRMRGSMGFVNCPFQFGDGTFTCDLTAPAGVSSFQIRPGAGLAAVLDNVSIREIQP